MGEREELATEGEVLLGRALEALNKELDLLRSERDQLRAQFKEQIEPLERRIARLESSQIHQRQALKTYASQEAFSTSLDSLNHVKLTDIAADVLRVEGKPMHYSALAEAVVDHGYSIAAKNRGAYVIGYLRREPERFCRTAKIGHYALLEWHVPDARPVASITTRIANAPKKSKKGRTKRRKRT